MAFTKFWVSKHENKFNEFEYIYLISLHHNVTIKTI